MSRGWQPFEREDDRGCPFVGRKGLFAHQSKEENNTPNPPANTAIAGESGVQVAGESGVVIGGD